MWSSLRNWERECENRGERIGVFKGIISTCKEFNISRENTIKNLTDKHGISADEAEQYMKQYW